jgi:hypothetical protein
MTGTFDALRNDQPRRRASLDLTDVQRLHDLADAPDEMLYQLRRALVVYRQHVLPHLALERAEILPSLTEHDAAADGYARILAEELGALVSRIETVQTDLLHDPASSPARSQAIGVLSAALSLATVAVRFDDEVLAPLLSGRGTEHDLG